MPSKGGLLHKKLKEKALKRLVTQFDIDKIHEIYIEPLKRGFSDVFQVAIDLFGLRAVRRFYPDIVFKYPLDEPIELGSIDGIVELVRDKKATHKIVVIECEVGANSQLLSGGLRRIGYEMLKKQYGPLLYLILAKYKDVRMTNTSIFDEIWEFERDDPHG